MWTSKKDSPEKPAQPPPLHRSAENGPGDDSASLQALTDSLGEISRMLDQTNHQVLEYLVHRDAQSGEGGAAGGEMGEQLAALADVLKQLGDNGPKGLDQKLDALYGKLDQLASGSRGSAAPAAGETGVSAASLRPLADKLDQVDAKLKGIAERAAAIDALKEAFVPTLVKVRDGLSEQHSVIGEGIRQVQQNFQVLPQYFDAIQQRLAGVHGQIDAGLREIVNILRPPQPEQTSAPAVSGDWQAAVLGDLAYDPSLQYQRDRLFSGLLGGEPEACGLVGNLLVFRSAAAERMPAALKEVGEAYYRWQPRTDSQPDPMERALVDWLQAVCGHAGVSNSIELVHPGQRFDSMRHNASERGVEITQVMGWIVLRDNGKVYTKAAVAVK
jgi:hypothetical protein